MNEYESLVLFPPELSKEDLEAAIAKVRSIFEKLGGEVTNTDIWPVRSLAYLVDDHHRGQYVVYEYRIDGQQLVEADRQLKLFETALRFSIVRKIKRKVIKVKKKKSAKERAGGSAEAAPVVEG